MDIRQEWEEIRLKREHIRQKFDEIRPKFEEIRQKRKGIRKNCEKISLNSTEVFPSFQVYSLGGGNTIRTLCWRAKHIFDKLPENFIFIERIILSISFYQLDMELIAVEKLQIGISSIGAFRCAEIYCYHTSQCYCCWINNESTKWVASGKVSIGCKNNLKTN